MSIIGLFLLAIAQMFSKMVLQFCIHTSNIYESYRCPAPMLPDVFLILGVLIVMSGFPDGSDSKESTCSTGDLHSIPGSRRSPREGNGNSLQYSCLENPMDRGAWWATVHGVTQSQTWLKQLSMYAWAPTRVPGAPCWSAQKNLWIISRNKDHRFLEMPVNISGSLPLSVGQGDWCLERKGLLRPLIRARSATLDSQSRTLLTASRGNGTQVFTLEWGTEPENNILHRILVALSSSDIYFVNKSKQNTILYWWLLILWCPWWFPPWLFQNLGESSCLPWNGNN